MFIGFHINTGAHAPSCFCYFFCLLSARALVGDHHETHINVRSVPDWEKSIVKVGHPRMLKVDTFLDFSGRLLGQRFFFKSFKLPKFGMTVRLAVVK